MQLDGRKLLKMTRETLASFTADYYIDQEDAELLLASAQLLRLYHIPVRPRHHGAIPTYPCPNPPPPSRPVSSFSLCKNNRNSQSSFRKNA